MTDCCTEFGTVQTLADREPNPIWKAHDDCGYQAAYKGLVGTSYLAFMPVRAGAAPGTVEPALDGVDAIGLALSTKDPVVLGNESITVARSIANASWADVAAAIGADPLDPAAWWPIHIELAKAGVYIAFN